MTQSQLTHQKYLASLRFYSLSSIAKWAEAKSGFDFLFLDDDLNLPYIEKNSTWYYFGNYSPTERSPEYRLVCTANKDLGAEQ